MISPELLEDVKAALYITWTDEDVRLEKLIQRSMAALETLTGSSLNFNSEGMAKELLLERCRYAYNNALNEFEQNYHSELSRLVYFEDLKPYRKEGEVIEGTLSGNIQ